MNSKIITLTIAFLLLILPVSALTVDPRVTIGSNTQEPATNVTTTFTITNTGNQTLTNFQLSSTASSIHNIYFNQIPLNLTPGQQAIVTVGGTIPLSFDASTSQCIPSSFQIGNIAVSASTTTGTENISLPLYMQRANHLVFKDLDISVDEDSTSFDEGDDVDIKPGSDISILADLENTFKKSGGFDIEDITLFVEALDSELNIDEDADVDNLRPDRHSTEEITFDIDLDVNDDKYDASVYICGVDENGARHGDRVNGIFNVEIEDDFLLVRSVDAPHEAQCGSTINFRIGIENIGKDDQNDAEVLIENDLLHISERVTDIEVEEDDTETARLIITLPSSAENGASFFEISAQTDDGSVTDTQTATLTITGCGTTSARAQVSPQQPRQVTPQAQPVYTEQPVVLPVLGDTRVYATPVNSAQMSFRTSGLYIPFLILLILVVIIVILLMLRHKK